MELVAPIAAEFRGRKGIPFEDLVASGREGLVRAARNWKPKAKFSTFATEYIRGYIKNFVADWQHLIPVGDSEEVERNFHEWGIWGSAAPFETWADLTATPEELSIAFDEVMTRQSAIELAIKFLPKFERNIIIARYFRDPPQTLNSIARENKIPYSTLVDLIKRTLQTLADRVGVELSPIEGTIPKAPNARGRAVA